MKREPKNNNLTKYREEMLKKNETLIKRAITHIQSLSGAVTFSAVSQVTYDIADIQNGQKGLTVAGITKNPLYRGLIERAKTQTLAIENTGRKSKQSIGDMNLSLHALRVSNAELKQENKILRLKLKEVPDRIETVEPIRNDLISKHNQLQGIVRSLVNRLSELEIAYVDMETRSLKLSLYNSTIIPREALEIFYKKELDAVKN